ncbi:unnamed protein product [Phytomonas sp. EM1]|nr:unnamed protein product [Phytomonas sp. EM1]|eukprot:CCW60510.1 unnamed protein product [Phytomonas sp. isolate EM1]
MVTGKNYKANLSTHNVTNGNNILSLPEIYAVTPDIAVVSNAASKPRCTMVITKKVIHDTNTGKRAHTERYDTMVSPRTSPKMSLIASKYPQQSREAISKRLTESVWEVVDAITQTPTNAEAPRRPLLLIEEWLSGDAALGLTPSVVLAGLTDLLYVLSRSIHLKGDPLQATRTIETNNRFSAKSNLTRDDIMVAREDPGKRTTLHDSTIVKFSGAIPTKHDPPHQQSQIDFANIHPESFLPPLVHRPRALPSWPCPCTATPNISPAPKDDISEKSLDMLASRQNTAHRINSAEAMSGSYSTDATHAGKPSTKTYNLPQNTTATPAAFSDGNFPYQYPHYIAEALEMLLVFCAKPLILLTLEDQQILSKAAYYLFEALAQVISDVSAYFSPLSANHMDSFVREEIKSLQTIHQDAVVTKPPTFQQCITSSKIAQRLHLAALRAMGSLIAQLHSQCDVAHFHSSTQKENGKRKGGKKGVSIPFRRDCDPSLSAKSTALSEFFDYLLQPKKECTEEGEAQELKQELDRSCALDLLVVYWNSLLIKSDSETHELRDRITPEKENDMTKFSVSKVAYLSESSTGETQRESKVSVEEELKAVLQTFEKLLSSAKKAFDCRESSLKSKRENTRKGNHTDIAQFPSTIPILTVYTLGRYVNTQSRVTSLCVDLLSLLLDMTPSATSRILLDINDSPQPVLQKNSLNDSITSAPFDYIFHTMLSLFTTLHSQNRLELLNDMLLFVETVLRCDTEILMGLQKTIWPANGNTKEDRPQAGGISPLTVDAINACMLLVFNAVCKDDLNSSIKRHSVWKAMDATLSSLCESATSRRTPCNSVKGNGACERNVNQRHQNSPLIDVANEDASEKISLMLQSIHLPKTTAMSSRDMRRELLYLKRLGWEVLERFMEWQSVHAEVAALQREIGLDSLQKNKGAIYEGYFLLDLCSMGFLDVLFMHINRSSDSVQDADASGAVTLSQNINTQKGLLKTGEDVEALQLESWELLTALINHTHRLRELFLSLKEKNFFLGAEYHGVSETPACIFMNECRGRIRSTEKSLAGDHYNYNFDDYIVSMGGISCAMRYLDASGSVSSKSRNQQELEGVVINPERLREPLCKAVLTFLAVLSRSGISGTSIAEAFLGMPNLIGVVINSLQDIRCHYNFTFKPNYEELRGSKMATNSEERDPNSVFFLPDTALDTTLLLLDLLKNLGAIAETCSDQFQEVKQTRHRLGYPEQQEPPFVESSTTLSVPCACPKTRAFDLIPTQVANSVSWNESEVFNITPGKESGTEDEKVDLNAMRKTIPEDDLATFHSAEHSSYFNNFSNSGGVDMLLNWIQLILSPCPRNALNVTGLASTLSQQQQRSVLPPLDESLSRYGPLLASLLHVLQNFILTNNNTAGIFIESEGVFVLLDAAEALAVASGIVGSHPVKNPEPAGGCKDDTFHSKTFENAPTIIASSFMAKDSPLLNAGLEQLRMELKTGITKYSESPVHNFISYCKNLLGYILTIVSDLLNTNVMAREHFMLWRSRRLQARDEKFIKPNSIDTGINAVQLLVSVWEFALRENFACPQRNDPEHTFIGKGSDVRSKRWSFSEGPLEEPIAGLSLLRVFIREKINMILRQGYIRHLVHRKVALGLLPSSIYTTCAPSLTNSNLDAREPSCPGAQERMENNATLLRYYVFVKEGRWVPSRGEGVATTDHGGAAVVEDWFESDEEKELALNETLTWLNTKPTMNASFVTEAISVWLKEHLVLGVKVYSCLAALGFERLISTVVAKDAGYPAFCQSNSVLLHSVNGAGEKESLSATNPADTIMTMVENDELPLTSAERSHIVVMASIPCLCIDELCLAMSSTANVFQNMGDTDEGCLPEYSVTHQSGIEPDSGLIRPTTSDRRYLRGILQDVLKRGQEVCELINLGYNLEQTYQTQKLDRFLITRLSKDVSNKPGKVRSTIASNVKDKETICISEIAENLRRQLFHQSSH